METIDYAMLYRIAHQYYERNLSQAEISKIENISRPHVSRMLSKARELGIVKIKITMPSSPEIFEMESRLKEELGLKSAHVIPVTGNMSLDPIYISKTIATFASQFLHEKLYDGQTVGIGWGRTMYETSLLLERGFFPNSTVVPLVGIVTEPSPYLQSNIIVDRFAEKLSAKSFYTPVLAVQSITNDVSLDEQKRHNLLLEWWSKLDVAVVGLGGHFRKGEFFLSETSNDYQEMIANSNTVGDILANFFYENGEVFDASAYYNQIAFPISKLRDVSEVICLAGGPSKISAIRTAAKNNFFTTLITDSQTARQLL